MPVIFDFDDVIFRNLELKKIIFDELKASGAVDVEEKYTSVRKEGKPFSLKSFLRLTLAETEVRNVEDMYARIMEQCPSLVNEDVKKLMQQLGADNCYIVTNGDAEFQLDKIRASIGEDLANATHIVPGSKVRAIQDICRRHSDQTVIFVDDKLENLIGFDGDEFRNLQTVLFDKVNGAPYLYEVVNRARKEQGLSEIKLENGIEELANINRAAHLPPHAGLGKMH